MIALVQQNLEAIEALCREYGVFRLELLGEASTGEFDPERSDLEFVVSYPDDDDFGPWIGRYQDLVADLSALLDREVRLVMENAPAFENRYIVKYFNETRNLLCSA